MDLGGGGDGTRGRTRTGTPSRAMDFESIVSTNFTTLAWRKNCSIFALGSEIA